MARSEMASIDHVAICLQRIMGMRNEFDLGEDPKLHGLSSDQAEGATQSRADRVLPVDEEFGRWRQVALPQ
jgi:hypothetical protein